jgi:cell division protein FtsB
VNEQKDADLEKMQAMIEQLSAEIEKLKKKNRE